MPAANLRKKALCIGISYMNQRGPYGDPPNFELAGSHNDVWKIVDLLTESYGYEREGITVLLDAKDYTQPTRENIISAMNTLMDEARSGDTFFFFFSGHGDQITNLDGTEDDCLDEIILPIDWQLDEDRPGDDRDRYSHIITDDEMNEILVQRLPHGCRLTALFDSCHSGTVLDLPYTRFYGPPSKRSPFPASKYLRHTVRRASPLSGHQILFDPQGGSTQSSYSLPQIFPQKIHSSPLDFLYLAINPRGACRDDNWRDGLWTIRGDTLDDEIEEKSPLKEVVTWSACADGQSGFEVVSVDEELSGGVMADAFVTTLKEKPYRTYRDILQCLGNYIRNNCHELNNGLPLEEWVIQEPQLGSLQKPDLDQLFTP